MSSIIIAVAVFPTHCQVHPGTNCISVVCKQVMIYVDCYDWLRQQRLMIVGECSTGP